MRFYTTQHPYYCGIDLHARSLYVCILDETGETILHLEIKARPEPLLDLNIIAFYRHEFSAIECFIEKHTKHHNS